MAKKPEIDHEYHEGKKARDNIVKKVIKEVERRPDRLIAGARKKSKKAAGKQPDGQQKETKLAEVGD